jgi:hypothetical protein
MRATHNDECATVGRLFSACALLHSLACDASLASMCRACVRFSLPCYFSAVVSWSHLTGALSQTQIVWTLGDGTGAYEMVQLKYDGTTSGKYVIDMGTTGSQSRKDNIHHMHTQTR